MTHRSLLQAERPTPSPPAGTTTGATAPGAADELVCRCLNVSRAELAAAVARGHRSFDALKRETGCGAACNSCVPTVLELLGEDPWVLAEVVAIREETADVRAIDLMPRAADYPAPLAGQHVIVEATVGAATLRRSYTIASASDALPLRVLIKREAQGLFTGHVFTDLRVGTSLRITRPRGSFLLDGAPGREARPAVCLVASIGVTPALALVANAARAPDDRTDRDRRGRRIVIHYSARTTAQMAALAELERAAREVPGLSLIVRETRREGRLGAAEIRALVADPAHVDADFFLCGPDDYLGEVARHLQAAGVPDSRVHTEVFTPAEIAARPRRLAGSIRYMLVPPAPKPRPLHARALRWLGTAIGRGLNSPRLDVRVGGRSLNPVHVASHLVGARMGIDPALPCAYLGALSDIAENPNRHLPYRFSCLDRLADRNRLAAGSGAPLPADTPDGDTFVYALPTVKLPKFPKECAVHTEWDGRKLPALMPVYALRGRTAVAHVLRGVADIDRGVIPYYFFQQVVGRRDIQSCPMRQAGGLGSGSYRENQTWAEDRQAATEMFGLPAIDKMSAVMAAVLPAVCGEIDQAIAADPDAVYDLNVLTTKIAYMMIIWTVFGDVDFAEFHALGEELTAAARRMFDYMLQLMYGGSLPPAWAADNLRMRQICREMIELLVDLDRRGQLTRRQRELPTVAMVLACAAAGPISDSQHERLFSLFLPFIFGGHETTGHSLCWTLYEMGRRPEVAARVVAEIDRFQAAHRGEPITIDRYDERPVTFAVLAETLRYHVLSGPISRMARTAGVVPPDPETGIGGFSYPAGTLFFCSPGAIHFDPRRWPDPHRFSIDRFLPEPEVSTSAPPAGLDEGDELLRLRARGRAARDAIRGREEALDLMSFGTGPARCPGAYFNWHESLLVLDALCTRYTFELEHPGREVRPSDHPLIGPEAGMIGVRIRPRVAG
jgi:ferredoxin-NADP reductase/cytochrome P450